MKIKYIAVLSLVALFLGFGLGRLSVTENTVVETKKVVKNVLSPYTVKDTVFSPSPICTYYNVRVDTLYLEKKVDTAEILADYFLSRKYKLDFSNDSIGKFIVNAEVNQNKLVFANSIMRPITRLIYTENTIKKKTVKMFQPWVTIGTNVNFDTQQVTFGLDLKQKYILGMSGIRLNNKYNYTLNVGIKF